jgi:pyridoxal phosphate enzyme (YggS family)
MQIAENLKRVKDNISTAAARADRDPDKITLVVVTKTRTPDEIREAAAAGVEIFGENRVQEAAAKIPELADLHVSWHMVGHLQRNKVKKALELFDVVQSLDSLRLAAEIDKRASAPVPCLLEVNTSGETSKFGVAPSEVGTVISELAEYPNIDLRGLMTVGPLTTDANRIRRAFTELAGLFAVVKSNADPAFRELSMGMTDDYETAIEEGATIVRIGRAIFGERPY